MRMPAQSRKPPWKKNPGKKVGKSSHKLSSGQKTAAKNRAKRAGRRYPNLVDNMWASQRGKASKRGRRT